MADDKDTSLHHPKPVDSAGHNEAGSPRTTNKEYDRREHGRQQVPTEHVGNPEEHVETDNNARPHDASDSTIQDPHAPKKP